MKPFSLKTLENLYINWRPLLLSGKWLTESSTPLPKTPQPTTYLQIYQKLNHTFLVFSFFFRPPHISFPSSRLHSSSAGGSSTSPGEGAAKPSLLQRVSGGPRWQNCHRAQQATSASLLHPGEHSCVSPQRSLNAGNFCQAHTHTSGSAPQSLPSLETGRVALTVSKPASQFGNNKDGTAYAPQPVKTLRHLFTGLKTGCGIRSLSHCIIRI